MRCGLCDSADHRTVHCPNESGKGAESEEKPQEPKPNTAMSPKPGAARREVWVFNYPGPDNARGYDNVEEETGCGVGESSKNDVREGEFEGPRVHNTGYVVHHHQDVYQPLSVHSWRRNGLQNERIRSQQSV